MTKSSVTSDLPGSGNKAGTEPESRYGRAVEDVNAATRTWIEQMGRMRNIEGELGPRLMACHETEAAVDLCSEWMTKRVASLVAVQHRLIDLWLDYDTAHLTTQTEQRRRGDT